VILALLVSSEEPRGMDLKKFLKVFEVKSADVVLGLDSRMSERGMNKNNSF
jgi:hypothetical protein